jgi:queuosine biosynthesis protein QueD
MKYTVSVTRTFSAAHALREYKGRCERLHGHTWKVRAAISGSKLDKTGMLVDFTDIKMLLDRIIENLDHHYLNEVTPFSKTNPTAENIAAFIYRQLRSKIGRGVTLSEVEVWESESSSAIVRP